MELISVGSSSSGNSYIIKAGRSNLLLDVGLSAAKIMSALSGCSIEPADVDAVLITHEHIDHVRSVPAVAKKCGNADFYVSNGTLCSCNKFDKIDKDRIKLVASKDYVQTGDAEIRCFTLSHDAREPIGYSVLADGKQITVVTDTGVVTDEIFEEMLNADILVFEANHDERLLMISEYPYSVKQRIKSDYGHLSNVSTAEVLGRLMDERSNDSCLNILLAHLSEKNNMPSEAEGCIKDALSGRGYIIGKDYSLKVAPKEGPVRVSVE